MITDYENCKEWLLNAYSADELVDVLNISAEELLDAFPDKLEEYCSECFQFMQTSPDSGFDEECGEEEGYDPFE